MALFKPTYQEVMDKINSENTDEDDKVLSRYSVVLAAAKRARQIVDDDNEKGESTLNRKKALSRAVDEIYSGKVEVHTK